MPRPKKLPGDPHLAIAYLRKSTRGQTVAQQRDAIEAWASADGVTIVAWFEEAVSGGAPLDERDAMLEALASLRPNRAGVLVAAKRCRIARNVSTAAVIERMTTEAGARLVTADGIDSGPSPEGQFIRQIFDAWAQYERALIGARTKAALGAKRKRKERIGSVPFGYRGVPSGRFSARGKPITAVVEHPGEQETLMRMRLLKAAGASNAAIAKALQEEGRQPRGERWHATTVQRALSV